MYRMDLRTASKTAPWPALADLVADHLRAGAVDRGQLDHEEAPVGCPDRCRSAGIVRPIFRVVFGCGSFKP